MKIGRGWPQPAKECQVANLRTRLHNVLVASIERGDFYQLQSIGIERAKIEALKHAVPDRALVAMVSASWIQPVPLASVQTITGQSARALEKEVLALIRAGFAHWRGENTLVVSPAPIPRDGHRNSHRYTRPNKKVRSWSYAEQASRLARRDRRSEKVLQPLIADAASVPANNDAGEPSLELRDDAGDTIPYTSITTSEEIFAESSTPEKNDAGDTILVSDAVSSGIPCVKSNVTLCDSGLRLECSCSSLRSEQLQRVGPATRQASSRSDSGSHATLDIDPTIKQLETYPTEATDHSSSTTMTARSPMPPSSSPVGSKSARRGKQAAPPVAASSPERAAPSVAKPSGPSAWQGLKDPRFGRLWDRWVRAHRARDEICGSRESAFRAWGNLKPEQQAAAAAGVDAHCRAYETDLDRPLENAAAWLKARGWAPAAPKVAATPEKRTRSPQKRSGGPLAMTSEDIWLAGCRFLLKTGKPSLLPGSLPMLDFERWKPEQQKAFIAAMRKALAEPGATADKLRSACPGGYVAVTGETLDLIRNRNSRRVKAHFEARSAMNAALLATDTKMAAPPKPVRGVFTQQELEAYCRDVGLDRVALASHLRY